jgi:hypothetical protein
MSAKLSIAGAILAWAYFITLFVWFFVGLWNADGSRRVQPRRIGRLTEPKICLSENSTQWMSRRVILSGPS